MIKRLFLFLFLVLAVCPAFAQVSPQTNSKFMATPSSGTGYLGLRAITPLDFNNGTGASGATCLSGLLTWIACNQIIVGSTIITGATNGQFLYNNNGVLGSAVPGSTGLTSFNVKNYGAIGDGTVHTANSALGISTLAALAAYTTSSGTTPYSYLLTGQDPSGVSNGYPYGTIFNLTVSQNALANANILNFGTTAIVGEAMPVTAAVTSSTHIPVNNWLLTAGMSFTGTGVSGGPTVSSSTSRFITASSPQTLSSGTLLTFPVGVKYGGYAFFVTDCTGIAQGDSVAGSGVLQNTYVEHVNQSTCEIRTNLTTSVTAGTSLSFIRGWLSHISVGMHVYSGTGTASGVVSAINNTTGAVTLSSSSLPVLYASTPNRIGTHALGSTVTFFAPYTDAQASALSMDGLGFQAAIQAAYNSGGGLVTCPAGTYFSSGPIILPFSPTTSNGEGGIGQQGVSITCAGRAQTVIEPVADFGPGIPLMGNGDPSATADNERGVFLTTFAAQQAWALLQDFQLTFSTTFTNTFGSRPCQGTSPCVPINMHGLRTAPRESYTEVNVYGFNHGIELTGDHTLMTDVVGSSNFVGIYKTALSVNEYDNSFVNVAFGANGWAGVDIDPYGAALNWNGGVKFYVGYNPYAFYFEPGYDGGGQFPAQALGTSFYDNIDAEGTGCGAFVDGNAQPNYQATGMYRGMFNITMREPYANYDSADAPQGGCPMNNAWIVVNNAIGMEMQNMHEVDNINFGPFPTGIGLIEVYLFDDYTLTGRGGASITGAGVAQLANLYGTACQGILADGVAQDGVAFTYPSSLSYYGSASKFRMEGPNWSAINYIVTDTGVSSGLPPGTIFEASQGSEYIPNNQIGARRAGQATVGTVPTLGISVGSYAACTNMNGQWVPVAQSGEQVPVLVPAQETVGTLLGVGTSTYGQSVVLSNSFAAGYLGYVTVGLNSTTNYMRLKPQ